METALQSLDVCTPLGYITRVMPRRPVSVIEFPGYLRRADQFLSADEQGAVVDLIAYEPTCGDLIPGTGGLRKVRIGRGGSGNVAARASSTISTMRTFPFCFWRSTPRMRKPT